MVLSDKFIPTFKKLVANTALEKPLKNAKRAIRKRIPKLSSGFCWIKETESFHTSIFVYNYWTENYGIDSTVKLRAELHDSLGNNLGVTSFDVGLDSVTVIKAEELLSTLDIALPFEGNLILTHSHRNLFDNLPLQVNVEFEYADSKVTTVHGLSTYVTPVEKAESIHCPILDNEDEESFIVVQNPYHYKNNPNEKIVECTIEIFNSEGNSIKSNIPPIPACGHYVASIRNLFPNIREFLSGKSGEALVWSEVPGGRYLTYTLNHSNDSMSVNHLSGAYKDIRKMLLPWETYLESGRGPMVVLPAILHKELQTSYMLFNECDGLDYHGVDVNIYDKNGSRVATLPNYLRLPKYGNEDFDISRILEDLNIANGDADFIGSITFSVTPDYSQSGGPAVLAGMSGYNLQFSENGFNSQVNVGFGIFNATGQFDGKPVVGRTKIFSRIKESEEWETFLWLTNPSSAEEYSVTSDTNLTIYTTSGKSELTKKLHIPPYGSCWMPVREIFPEVIDILKDDGGVGFLKVRDVTAKLVGVHLVRNIRTGAIASDHLFGG